MALSLTELNAITRDFVEKGKVTQNYWKGNALAARCLQKPKFYDSGEKIRELLEIDELNGGPYTGIGSFDMSLKEITNAAKFSPAHRQVAVVIAGYEEEAANGEEGLIDLAQTKIKAAATKMSHDLGSDLYNTSAASGGRFLSLIGDLFNETTSTEYGEIAEDDVSEWKANVLDASALTHSKATVWDAARRLAKVGSEVPDLWVTDDTVKDAFENFLVPNQRYRSKDMPRLGFAAEDTIMYGSAVVMSDQKLTYSAGSARIFGINTEYFFIRIHRRKNFLWQPWQRVTDGDGKSMNLLLAGQFTTNQRRAHVMVKNLTA